MIILISAVCL